MKLHKLFLRHYAGPISKNGVRDMVQYVHFGSSLEVS